MPAPAASAQPPSPDYVQRIADLADPVLRNCCITQGYHELSLAMSARAPAFANWLMFAVWASRAAGQTIRGEDLRANFQRHLHLRARWLSPFDSLWRSLLRRGLLSPNTKLGQIVRAIPGPLDAIEHASAAIAAGNKLIFGEVGRAFALYFLGAQQELRQGDPPDGQGFLLRAFEHYDRALAESDPAVRAQWQYLANVEIAWHEQVRAQPLVEDAMNGPLLEVRDLGERVLVAIAPPPLRVAILAFAAGLAVKPLAACGLRIARAVITETLMTLWVPDLTLALGQAIELPCPGCLERLDLPELRNLLARFDGEDPRCGAEDWSRLEDRMRYIARFFRVFHSNLRLAETPFTPQQLDQLQRGILPSGRL